MGDSYGTASTIWFAKVNTQNKFSGYVNIRQVVAITKDTCEFVPGKPYAIFVNSTDGSEHYLGFYKTEKDMDKFFRLFEEFHNVHIREKDLEKYIGEN